MYAPERGEHLQPLKAAAALGAAFLCTPEAKGKSNRGVEGGGIGHRAEPVGASGAPLSFGGFREKKKKKTANGFRSGDGTGTAQRPGMPRSGLREGSGRGRGPPEGAKLPASYFPTAKRLGCPLRRF